MRAHKRRSCHRRAKQEHSWLGCRSCSHAGGWTGSYGLPYGAGMRALQNRERHAHATATASWSAGKALDSWQANKSRAVGQGGGPRAGRLRTSRGEGHRNLGTPHCHPCLLVHLHQGEVGQQGRLVGRGRVHWVGTRRRARAGIAGNGQNRRPACDGRRCQGFFRRRTRLAYSVRCQLPPPRQPSRPTTA